MAGAFTNRMVRAAGHIYVKRDRVVVGNCSDIEVHVVSHCERERGKDGCPSTAVERNLDFPFGDRRCPNSSCDGCCSVLSVRNYVDVGSACVLSLGGCAVGPNFIRPTPPWATRYTGDTPRGEGASANDTAGGREI